VSEALVVAANGGPASVAPEPDTEEAIAIMAAYEALWPKPVVLVADGAPSTPPWRFSGRWWAAPVARRRARPGG
jgi:hypothetical protein